MRAELGERTAVGMGHSCGLTLVLLAGPVLFLPGIVGTLSGDCAPIARWDLCCVCAGGHGVLWQVSEAVGCVVFVDRVCVGCSVVWLEYAACRCFLAWDVRVDLVIFTRQVLERSSRVGVVLYGRVFSVATRV